MFERAKPYAIEIWRRFRALPIFWQLVLSVPTVCGLLVTLLVGNMGLALMGTAIAINAFLAGAFGGLALVIVGKAGVIVARDKRRR